MISLEEGLRHQAYHAGALRRGPLTGARTLTGRSGKTSAVGLHALIAIQAFRPHVGGAELQLERLAPHLAEHGISSEIVTRAVSGWPRRERIPGATVYRTPLSGESPLASIAYVSVAAARILRRRRAIDLVHAHGALSPATIGLAGRLAGLPCLVTVLGTGPHGDLARLARKPLGRMRARLLSRLAWFVALSAEARDGAARARRARRAHPRDPQRGRPRRPPARGRGEREALRERLGLPAGRFVGAFVGRLHPVKDVDTLLEAAARVPELFLVVVGDGPERGRLEARAAELELGPRVTVPGPVAAGAGRPAGRRRLPAVVPRRGHVERAAGSDGLRTALPRQHAVGGARELLGDGRGLLVAGGDAAAWADAIERLAADPALRERLGEAAAGYVAESLSLGAAAERLGGALRRAQRRGGVSPPAVLYVVSRFPSVTETFVVNEWLALSERFRMEMVALRHSGEEPIHPESRRMVGRVRYLGTPGPPISPLTSAGWLRRPRTYLVGAGRPCCGQRSAAHLRDRRRSTGSCSLQSAVARPRRACARTGRPRPRAFRQPSGHRGVDRASPHRHPVQLHRPRQRPVRDPALIERKAADARFAVAISGYNRERLLDALPGRRVQVVHCGVELERHPWRGPAGRDRDLVLCVASLSAKKGHAHLIEALPLLAERRPASRSGARGRRARARPHRGARPQARRGGSRAAARGQSSDEVRARLAAAGAFALPSVRLAERPDGGHPGRADGGDGERRAGGGHQALRRSRSWSRTE